MCGCLSCTPYWRPGLQSLRSVPYTGNQTCDSLMPQHSTTAPRQPGLDKYFLQEWLLSLGQRGSVGWSIFPCTESCQFKSQSRHMRRLQVQSSVTEWTGGNRLMLLSDISFYLPLSPFPSFKTIKINNNKNGIWTPWTKGFIAANRSNWLLWYSQLRVQSSVGLSSCHVKDSQFINQIMS